MKEYGEMVGWSKGAGKISEQELRETIRAAHDALSEIARTRGLDPTGEHARDLCTDALARLENSKARGRSC